MCSVVGLELLREVSVERDHTWLEQTLFQVWTGHFPDTPKVNIVRINYGPAWKSRLGLITLSEDQATTFIELNGLLRLPGVPGFVATITVAHELVHYAHGFGSPLARRYKHPHRGGIIKRELIRRGMLREYQQYEDWVYGSWYDFYYQQLDQDARPISESATARSS